MLPRRLIALGLATLVYGCSGEPEAAASAPPEPEPQSSEVLVSAVDAGTQAALTDRELTLRYLVRTPITLDASAVVRVSATEPYRIAHAVSSDSLVVELRLEAPSYERLDTVLAVARGATAGPIKVALTPHADGKAAATQPARPGATAGTAGTAGTATATTAAASAGDNDESLDAAVDRTPLKDGDAAFGRQDWRGAAAAYRRMAPPRARRASYAKEYQLALVRLGISLINQNQMPGAQAALRDAAALPFREYTVYFYLGQVECTLGQFDAGRRSLAEIDRLAPTISEAQRPIVLALNDYQRAVCSHTEFQQARGPAEEQRTAGRALEELEAFVQKGQAMRPVPPQIAAAVADAQKRIREIAGR